MDSQTCASILVMFLTGPKNSHYSKKKNSVVNFFLLNMLARSCFVAVLCSIVRTRVSMYNLSYPGSLGPEDACSLEIPGISEE